MSLQTFRVSVCYDCHLVAAGYDTRELGHTPNRVPWSRWPESLHAIAEGQEPHFGKYPCEGCGSREHGDRFDDVVWMNT